MCGRFTLTLPVEAMEELFEATATDTLPPQTPRYNICPTQMIPAIVAHDGARHIAPMRWGFIPRWYKAPNDGPLLINARSETIAEKPAFRDAARKRRCLIPASGFYEWTHRLGRGKEPWYIRSTGNAPLVFAGIWQGWTPPEGGDRLVTCAIVTCAASADIADVHDRMPVLIAPEDQALWLGEDGDGAARLMRPAPTNSLRKHRVSTQVNSMRAEGESLVNPALM